MKATAVANPVTQPIASVTIELTGEEATHLLTFLGLTAETPGDIAYKMYTRVKDAIGLVTGDRNALTPG
jgi:hypothetical protein